VKAWIEARGREPIDIRPGKSGQFDIVVDEKLVYSRYEMRHFPSDADLEKIQF
jgi:predicted Rdx family selenoprotein